MLADVRSIIAEQLGTELDQVGGRVEAQRSPLAAAARNHKGWEQLTLHSDHRAAEQQAAGTEGLS